MKITVTILYGFISPAQLVAGTLFFCLLIGAIILSVLAYLSKRLRRSNYRQVLRYHYSELIGKLAMAETDEDLEQILTEFKTDRNVMAWLQDSYARHILIKELVIGAKNISGTSNNNICWFYSKMGLEQDTLNRLMTKDWHIKAKAIQTLSYLRQKQHTTRIYRYTNSHNELVRHEAHIAVVKLIGFGGLRFLDIISYPISEWQQLHLLHELSNQHKTDPGQISRWLKSPNHSVVEFALKLVEVYRIFELHPDVALLLLHPADAIRKKAIQTLVEIRSNDTADILLRNYKEQTEPVQLAMIKALQQAGTEKEITFLSSCLSHERDDFKMAAARAIRSIKKEGISVIEQAINKTLEPWPVLLPQLLREGYE